MATHAPAPETKAQTINRLLVECPLTLPTTTWTEIQRMLKESYEKGFSEGWALAKSTPIERTRDQIEDNYRNGVPDA